MNDPLADECRKLLAEWDRPWEMIVPPPICDAIDRIRHTLAAHDAREAAVARLVAASEVRAKRPHDRICAFIQDRDGASPCTCGKAKLHAALADYRASSPTSPVDPSPDGGK